MTRDNVREELTHLRDEAAILLEAYLARPLLRGVSHLVAFIAALGGVTALIVQAGAALQVAASLVYGIGLAAMLGTSAMFHRIKWRPRAYKWVRKIDHSMIFVLIASSSTPFMLLTLDGGWRIGMLIGIWSLAITGVVLRMSIEHLPRPVMVALYIGVGWSGIAVFPALSRAAPASTVLALIGGLLYTFGAVVYLTQRPNPLPKVFGFHEVFHAFVVAAATCHFLAVWPIVTGSNFSA